MSNQVMESPCSSCHKKSLFNLLCDHCKRSFCISHRFHECPEKLNMDKKLHAQRLLSQSISSTNKLPSRV